VPESFFSSGCPRTQSPQPLAATTLSNMKAIKRTFLDVDEVLRFNASNNFEIERHFSALNMDFENNTLNLWFDHSYAVIPDSITVEAVYLDASKKIEKYEAVEFIETFDIPLPKVGILKHNEFSIPILLQENSKYLWQIVFKIYPKIVCVLHMSVS
jgi:hypothetical protein